MTAKALATLQRALLSVLALGATALVLFVVVSQASAGDIKVASVVPATISPELEALRLLRPGYSAPELTNELLAAYVQRQQELQTTTLFETDPAPVLTEQVLLGYIDRTRNPALDAIDIVAAPKPALNADILAAYAAKQYVPTVRKVKQAGAEKLCLTQAIYHEARGESEAGQWAVANVIINRALSKKFPSTLCGVVFQNAENGYHRCQFTFACDGRSDMGTERRAWARAVRMADAAYQEFRLGERPGVIPSSALFYHTLAVSPSWSSSFRRVAAIGSHVFYAKN